MAAALDALRTPRGWNRPVLACLAIILALLLLNALLHAPTGGYDAQDHIHYVQALATYWHLPNKEETGQYYSPPLPYILPAILTSLQLGLWKALKLAQLFNVLLAAGLLVYLLKICELASPQNTRLKLFCLTLLGLLPVFYRSFALVRGEPYLAFLAVFVSYQSLAIFLQGRASAARVVLLGVALGLAILARQWGFFLFPPVLAFAAWSGLASPRKTLLPLGIAVLSTLIGALIGGWFYILSAQRFGTATAFDRAPQPLSANVALLFTPDADSIRVFSDPIRPTLDGRLLPILYADTWGDYWGYFLLYARNVRTGEFENGAAFQRLTNTQQLNPDIETNRFTMRGYLGALNIGDLVPTALLLAGLVWGCLALARIVRGKGRGNLDSAATLLAMVAGLSLLGFLWFILRYQTARQAGDLVKATYLLQAYAPLSFLGGIVADGLWERRAGVGRALAILLAMLFAAELPALVTHYVHIATTPGWPIVLGSSVLFVAGLWVTYWVHSHRFMDIVVNPAAPPPDAPLISVCVPARNEAANIRRCLEAILAQTYRRFEVIAVDDRSTDATPQILGELATDARLRVLHGAQLPEGWAGKPHALAQAAAVARGEWLCFVDADTFLQPEALAGCFAKASETGADLFTIMTRQVAGSFWERTVMPIVLTALSVGFPPRQVNDPKRRNAIANGQFILIRRDVYDTLGGHERIRDRIVEDKALAELVKWNGYRLIVADGHQVATTRMYTSLPQMWEGWTKNIYLGLREQPGLVLLGAFGGLVLVLAAFVLPLWPALGLAWLSAGGGWPALIVILQSLVVWAAVSYARASAANAMGISRLYALTTPLGAAVFAAMMLVSAWNVLSGRGVTWRGRRYTPRPPARG